MVNKFSANALMRLLPLILIVFFHMSPVFAGATAQADNLAAALRSTYSALGEKLSHNQFQRALYLNSIESSNNLKGDIYALVDYPFTTVSAALNGPAHWCDVLILHLNTKYCRAEIKQDGTVLRVSIGRKYDQPLEDAFPFEFAYHVAATTSGYFQIELDAPQGPLGTSNYKIQLEVLKLDSNRTFLHLMYSYDYGLAGELAMKVYLATAGSDKVGFTVTGIRPNGQPDYIRGLRGVVERNAMRYYLAIEAYLSEFNTDPAQQFEKRLQNWYNATEQYSRQLHEVERTEYMQMKNREYLRQRDKP